MTHGVKKVELFTGRRVVFYGIQSLVDIFRRLDAHMQCKVRESFTSHSSRALRDATETNIKTSLKQYKNKELNAKHCVIFIFEIGVVEDTKNLFDLLRDFHFLLSKTAMIFVFFWNEGGYAPHP